ncbi:ribosomal protein S12 methylthiotransferase rimO [Desulfovibrio sp. A2]|nr:ribosomal protein S12 methylthiotransferase rimO [Desulfovibrio sp. A2]
MISVYSVSLGCPKNRVDTERLLGALGAPVRPVETMAEADVVLVNTCGFILPAVEESVRTVVEAVDEISGLARRPLLAVAGCLVGRYGERDLAAELPEVDLWLPNQSIESWPELLARAVGARVAGVGAVAPGYAGGTRLLSTGPSYAWLKISDGCRHNCSFCTIPSIRGAHRSTPAAELEREARQLLDMGVRELILVAQDVTAWGSDADGNGRGDLRPLLDRLLPLPGLDRLRLMYLYPAGLNDDLLSYLAAAGAPFVPYFDVPLQHAHPDVLGRMGRPFARNPRAVVERIRKHFPDAALRTSIIVGFPGETEEHYAALTDFVAETRFHHLGVFAYRAEEGTPAAAMPDQVDDTVKEWRRDALMEVQAEISEEIMESYVGQRLPVLVDAPHDEWPGLHTGRTWFQAPEIDGVTYVSGAGVAPGALVEADIVEARTYDLVALAEPEE